MSAFAGWEARATCSGTNTAVAGAGFVAVADARFGRLRCGMHRMPSARSARRPTVMPTAMAVESSAQGEEFMACSFMACSRAAYAWPCRAAARGMMVSACAELLEKETASADGKSVARRPQEAHARAQPGNFGAVSFEGGQRIGGSMRAASSGCHLLLQHEPAQTFLYDLAGTSDKSFSSTLFLPRRP